MITTISRRLEPALFVVTLDFVVSDYCCTAQFTRSEQRKPLYTSTRQVVSLFSITMLPSAAVAIAHEIQLRSPNFSINWLPTDCLISCEPQFLCLLALASSSAVMCGNRNTFVRVTRIAAFPVVSTLLVTFDNLAGNRHATLKHMRGRHSTFSEGAWSPYSVRETSSEIGRRD